MGTKKTIELAQIKKLIERDFSIESVTFSCKRCNCVFNGVRQAKEHVSLCTIPVPGANTNDDSSAKCDDTNDDSSAKCDDAKKPKRNRKQKQFRAQEKKREKKRISEKKRRDKINSRFNSLRILLHQNPKCSKISLLDEVIKKLKDSKLSFARENLTKTLNKAKESALKMDPTDACLRDESTDDENDGDTN